jgi:hypothetical protein
VNFFRHRTKGLLNIGRTHGDHAAMKPRQSWTYKHQLDLFRGIGQRQ